MTTQRIARIALLTSVCHVSRVMFGFIPNVQPMTVILILITLVFGFSDGLIVAILSMLISNLQMGMGVWTIAQTGSFAMIIIATSLIRPFYKKIHPFLLAIFAGSMGLFYGFSISLGQSFFFTWISFFPYWISGLPFDFLHAFGNIGFWFILHPILIPMFEKIKKQENKTYHQSQKAGD